MSRRVAQHAATILPEAGNDLDAKVFPVGEETSAESAEREQRRQHLLALLTVAEAETERDEVVEWTPALRQQIW